jgi:MFS family permease
MRAAGATYREVFAVREFRALFASYLLSLLGDQLARVAVSVLVYDRTGSALLAALTFGVSYLPWVVVGPLLAALSDRFPRRTVMITCDVVRGVLFAGLAQPGVPVAVLICVLFAASLLAPPFMAARSATMTEVLDGDGYVVGTSVSNLCFQLAQVLGFAAGGALVAVISARGAIIADAATFAVSALLLHRYVADRRSAPRGTRSTVIRDTVDGFHLVLTDRALRTFVFLAWAGAAFNAAPEGLMTAYAAWLGGGSATVGLLLAAMPLGTVCAAVVFGRFTAPTRRWRQVPAMALLCCVSLTPIAVNPPLPVVLILLVLAGYGAGYQLAVNARFMRDVPASHRGRAFGVAAAGLMIGQGTTTVAAGWLVDTWDDPPLVVGLCGLVGVVAVAFVLPAFRSVPWRDP